ncbi:MAG TPA: transmembrane ion channel [Cytophagales bacterium]|nr:transmembrane ion channel [Cytophagales bacterium]HAP64426.1 transmembrane ion channel [Cytophagales bacterium]
MLFPAHGQTTGPDSAKTDSVVQMDSLQQARLIQELMANRTADLLREAQLQAQLMALEEEKQARAQQMLREMDSLRGVTEGAAVAPFEDTLFFLYAPVGAFTAQDRAEHVRDQLNEIVETETGFVPDSLRIIISEGNYDLVYLDQMILSITPFDAAWAENTQKALAQGYLEQIQLSVVDYEDAYGTLQILKRVGIVALLLILIGLGYKYLNKLFQWGDDRILNWSRRRMKGLKLRNYEFLSVEQQEQVVHWVLIVVKWIIIAVLLYLVLPVLFSIFPATKGLAQTLFSYVLDPLKSFAWGFINYIPSLITIVVILVITYYFDRFLRFLAQEVEQNKLHIPGFYSDWSMPTYNLLKIITYTFAFVMIFPNLPGSDSNIFRGVSVFFGLLISLGSSGAISNIIAGLVITYMRAFKVGDFVKIGETEGVVIEKSMLVTRLRTIKNEDVTIPNVSILNGATINYSSQTDEKGLILNTEITLGYEHRWEQVHELLIGAAKKTENVKAEPAPYVLQTALDDQFVRYEINAFTDIAEIADRTYSSLHANIQSAFREAKIDLLAPQYEVEHPWPDTPGRKKPTE